MPISCLDRRLLFLMVMQYTSLAKEIIKFCIPQTFSVWYSSYCNLVIKILMKSWIELRNDNVAQSYLCICYLYLMFHIAGYKKVLSLSLWNLLCVFIIWFCIASVILKYIGTIVCYLWQKMHSKTLSADISKLCFFEVKVEITFFAVDWS